MMQQAEKTDKIGYEFKALRAIQLSILTEVEKYRSEANSKLNQKTKGSLGQFFTPQSIALYMASMFESIQGEVVLLDPGAGPGSLTAAFIDEAIKRLSVQSISIHAFEIDQVIHPFLQRTLDYCKGACIDGSISAELNLHGADFVDGVYSEGLFRASRSYTHVIMNPPYKKISAASDHRRLLSLAGIETVNLYSGFVSLAIKQLASGGELVAIIPRSFCNGPYYQAFRELITSTCAINHIHLFDSRNVAFAEDEVLQENIIIHLTKGKAQGSVVITSSPTSDFHLDYESGTVTASDMTIRTVDFGNIVYPNDKEKFFHIAANDRDLAVIQKLSVFACTLKDLGVGVSTGPVVSFRAKDDLRDVVGPNSVPLLNPSHLGLSVNWPKTSKKPNAIEITPSTKKSLWVHKGAFVFVRRFSSKEEKRRIVATLYESDLPGELIGLDNGLNVFHKSKSGFDSVMARGLFVYLNSTLLDKYYRNFGGHTQVNATDLKNLNYPSLDSLRRLGERVGASIPSQADIDHFIDEEIFRMTGENDSPLHAQQKIDEALTILVALGLPRAQQNERTALTLLALIDLAPNGSWAELKRPLLGVTPIMSWVKERYGKEYAPNTRETFRRQTLHQFVDAGLCLYNPDKPDRAVNSPSACYQIALELFHVLVTYGTPVWDSCLKNWLQESPTLISQYAMGREMELIPLTLNGKTEIKLSPGAHSQLIHDIVTEFGPRFAPGAEVIYLGDTGAKEDFFEKTRLAELGVVVDRKGKLPDVVLYWPERNWLLLIESVTSHGPVDGKRHGELAKLFAASTAGLVYVSAFPDRKTMVKYLSVLAWETEVWVADAPTHMIHFNGDRFLGPHL
ncbi:BsuBI/PstI family type II restriction endonuclease [Pseudomonas syringae]|uniref:BsuBI/PstI family type II restriction endonuclease n=1 Tax=Pseudomonas syringae TaxID=317 RepID=UPI001D107A18|nr:BsuBI/PstI family type II restriction endonuclease [Pseudomonas syringae]